MSRLIIKFRFNRFIFEFLIFYEETGILSVCKSENFGIFTSKCEIFGIFTRINFEDFGKKIIFASSKRV